MSELTEKRDEPTQESSMSGEDLEKYRELYGFSKETYIDGTERIRRTEDKAAKLVTLCGSLIAFAGFIGIFILDSFIPPRMSYDWACLVCFLSFIVVVGYAFANLMGTLNITTRLANPLNQAMITYFDKESYPKILRSLAQKNVEAVEFNASEHERKIKKFKCGYRAIFCSLVILAIFVISQILKAWMIRKCGG